MYIDKGLLISDGQSLTSSGPNKSDYSVNVGAAVDIGAGRQFYVVVVVDTSAHSDDASDTVAISFLNDNDADLSSATTVLTLPTITGALLTAGRIPIIIAIPPNLSLQYVGLNYELSAAFTSGLTVTAFLAIDVQTNL